MKRLRRLVLCVVVGGCTCGTTAAVLAAADDVPKAPSAAGKAAGEGIARRKRMPAGPRELLPPSGTVGTTLPGSTMGTTPGYSTTVPPLAPLPTPPSVGPAKPQSEQAPKRSLADCMKLWERATHMTKQEWRATCQRSIKAAEAADRANAALDRAARKKKKREGALRQP